MTAAVSGIEAGSAEDTEKEPNVKAETKSEVVETTAPIVAPRKIKPLRRLKEAIARKETGVEGNPIFAQGKAITKGNPFNLLQEPSASDSVNTTASKKSVSLRTKPASPATKPVSPVKKLVAPATKPASPTTKSASPAKKPASPAKKPVSQAKKPALPATKPVSPAKKPMSPAKKLASPEKKLVSPAKKPVSPATKQVSPAKKPTSPTTKPEAPAKKPASPTPMPVSPARKPVSPATKQVAPAKKLTSPTTKPASPGIKTVAPGTKPTSPGKKLVAPGKTTPNQDVPQTEKSAVRYIIPNNRKENLSPREDLVAAQHGSSSDQKDDSAPKAAPLTAMKEPHGNGLSAQDQDSKVDREVPDDVPLAQDKRSLSQDKIDPAQNKADVKAKEPKKQESLALSPRRAREDLLKLLGGTFDHLSLCIVSC